MDAVQTRLVGRLEYGTALTERAARWGWLSGASQDMDGGGGWCVP